MNQSEFINLTKEMRQAQKEYFAAKYGDPEKTKILHRSKELEKRVDAEIEEFTNPNLFS